MPCIKKMVQESESASKPTFIHGHFFGAVGVLAGSERTINPVMIVANHSNAAFLEKQGRKHNRISLINLSIWYFTDKIGD